jgi:hypothetical protein
MGQTRKLRGGATPSQIRANRTRSSSKENRQREKDMRKLKKLIKMNDKKHKRKMKELKKILEEPVPKGYVPYVESEPNNKPKNGDVSKPKNDVNVEQMMLNGDVSKPKSDVNKSNNDVNNLAKSFGKVRL